MTTPLLTTRASIGTLDLSVIDALGTMWVLEDLQGWGSPGPTLTLAQKPRAHGGVASESYLKPRTLVLTGTVYAADATVLSQAVDSLNAAVTLTPTTLTVWENNIPRYMTVQRQDEVLVSWIGANAASFSVQLVAADPRKYGAPASFSTFMPSQTGGLTYPITYPITYSATVVSGQISVFNPGNAPIPVFMTVTVPSVGAIITHTGLTSQTFALAPIGDSFVTIDMTKFEVLGNGQAVASRNGYVLTPSARFDLDPGANTIAYNGQTYDPTSQLSLTVPQGAWL